MVDNSWSCRRAPHESHQFASRRCPWTALNYRTEQEQQANFASKRRRERAMFKLLIPSSWTWQLKILIWSSFENGQLVVLVGKNHGSCGWKSFFRIKVARGSELEYDGCKYGLRFATGGFLPNFLRQHRKSSITSTRRRLAQGGMNMSEHKDFYSWHMCRSIAQTGKSELYPEQLLQRLHAPVTSMMTEEECLFSLGLCGAEHELLPRVLRILRQIQKW